MNVNWINCRDFLLKGSRTTTLKLSLLGFFEPFTSDDLISIVVEEELATGVRTDPSGIGASRQDSDGAAATLIGALHRQRPQSLATALPLIVIERDEKRFRVSLLKV